MAVCTSCGQENPEIARFCLACGTTLTDEQAPSREERRVVSIIFVDLVGFTARAERLDPEDVRAILTPYHDTVRREIESFGGVVEKFIGDAVMGVFGAPTAYGDDAERAVRAALAVADSVRALNAADESLDLQIRIAVNTGEALVNLAAKPERGEAMVAGDVVNTAQRLQHDAPENEILVGPETHAATRSAIEYEPATAVHGKGKTDPVPTWRALRAETPVGERRTIGSFVGRTRELAMLRGIWERVVQERTPHLVTVLGPAGAGKSRVTQEFERLVEADGGRALRGRSLPYRESSAYFGFASQVKQVCEMYDSDPPEVALRKLRETLEAIEAPGDCDAIARHLAILIGLDREGVVDDRETLFFSVRCFIEAVARQQPTLLVFEDIHWADRSLLDLIELLAVRLRDLPVLVLTLARPELLDARPAWGGGLTAYSALPLPPLSPAEAQELATLLLDDAQADRAIRLAETAEGNPLFIEQLAATVSEAGAPDTESLPTTVRGIVAARLDALPAAERTVLLDAAVFGKTFWRGALDQVGRTGDGFGELLAALERRDLIVRDTDSIIEAEPQFSFKHVLIREVAYELLPRAERRERHAAAARFFENSTAELGETAAATARHWRDAGEPERALGYFVSAAEQAERGWAKDQAAILYREALDLVSEDDGAQLSDLRRRIALARAAAVHIPDARYLIKGSQPA